MDTQREQKIHQLVFAAWMVSLIIWPYLQYLPYIAAAVLFIMNVGIAYEYIALFTCVHLNEPVTPRPFQRSICISDT